MNRILYFLVLVAIFTSCKKKYDNDESALVNLKIETAFDEITNISDQAVTGNLIYYNSGKIVIGDYKNPNLVEKSPCNVTITHDTTSNPKVLTVDYGTTNCDCKDGKTRRGKIITTYTGGYLATGTVITHTTENYYVNDIKIDGSKTVTNMGVNSAGQPYFNVEINGVATLTSGTVVNYNSSRVRTWVNGYDTPLYRLDDRYEITGTANATYSNGGGYAANTTAPIVIKVGCGFPTKGTISMTPINKATRVIDYGDGSCDLQFTVTVNGKTYTFN